MLALRSQSSHEIPSAASPGLQTPPTPSTHTFLGYSLKLDENWKCGKLVAETTMSLGSGWQATFWCPRKPVFVPSMPSVWLSQNTTAWPPFLQNPLKQMLSHLSNPPYPVLGTVSLTRPEHLS